MTLRFFVWRAGVKHVIRTVRREHFSASIHHKRGVNMVQPLLTTARQGLRNAWVAFGLLSLLALAALALSFNAPAAQPRIQLIEPFVNNQVLVHFDTEANRTYILQYTSYLSATSHWSNLFTALAFPFPDHYIVVDTRAAPQRFYRLSVTP